MADTIDPTDPPPPAKPITTRRRAPRKPAAKAPAKPASATKPKATTAPATPTVSKRAAPAKPRSTSRAKPAPKRRAPAKAKTSDVPVTPRGRWGFAAILGGVAAIGATAAALLSLRGSTTKKPKLKTAHMPDGKDASKSFQAGIADANVIPDKV